MSSRGRGLVAWAAAFALLLLPAVASAVIPTGSFQIPLGGSQSVWLGSDDGEAEFCAGFQEGFGGMLDECSLSIFVDAKGKLSGAARVSARNGALVLDFAGPVKGKLKGSGGGAAYSFSIKLAGEGGNGAQMLAVKANVAFAGNVSANGALSGNWSFSFCTKAGGCLADGAAQAPETIDGGDWTLALEITDAGGGSLGGSATAMLADGTLCTYALGGKYNAKKDLASLKFSPQGAACKGTSIQLKNVQGGAVLRGDIKYKLFGASGSASVESAP